MASLMADLKNKECQSKVAADHPVISQPSNSCRKQASFSHCFLFILPRAHAHGTQQLWGHDKMNTLSYLLLYLGVGIVAGKVKSISLAPKAATELCKLILFVELLLVQIVFLLIFGRWRRGDS